jgi:hypothetical protein
MKDSIDIAKFLFEQQNLWVILVTIIIAIPFLVKLLKEISTISHTIEIKNIESFSTSITEESTSGAKYKLEKYFSQLYKRSFTHKEIMHLLSFDSPSTAIQDYIWGLSFLKFEQDKIQYNKEYRFGVIKWLTGITFMVSSLAALILFLFFVAGVFVSADAKVLFNLVFLTISSIFLAWFSLSESRDAFAAQKIIKNQPVTAPTMAVAQAA